MKDDEKSSGGICCDGRMIVLAALLLAVGTIVGCYLLSQGDYAPKVDLSGFKSNPNIYVTQNPTDHAITASGTADQLVAPDLLQISLRVVTQSTDAKTSQSRNAEVSAELRSNLEALGLADNMTQTTSYDVEPVYNSQYVCDVKNNCQYNSTLIGYRTTQSLEIDLDQLDKGGAVIDAAAATGNNETFVDSTTFTLKPETKDTVTRALLEEAAADSKAKAQSMADGMGTTLGNVLSASENSYYYPIYSDVLKSASMEAAATPAPTQLSAGQVDVSVSMTASYAVGG